MLRKVENLNEDYLSNDSLLTKEFWVNLNPYLNIENIVYDNQSIISYKNLVQDKNYLVKQGYLHKKNSNFKVPISLMKKSITGIVNYKLPPVFAFVYDEFWYIQFQLRMLLEKFLDKNYKQLPDFWAWHVSSGQSGWGPHRDKAEGSLFKNSLPKSLTVWIPLSKASPINSCMYMLPANKDKFYNKPKLNSGFPGALSDIRALPAEAGDVLMWTQEVYHWGSSSCEDSLNEPRISIAFEFQRSDVAPFNTLLLEPNLLPTFNDRLALISMQILQYTHMYGFKKDLVYWAQSYIEKYKKELSLV
jgi:hypothetical protein